MAGSGVSLDGRGRGRATKKESEDHVRYRDPVDNLWVLLS